MLKHKHQITEDGSKTKQKNKLNKISDKKEANQNKAKQKQKDVLLNSECSMSLNVCFLVV